MRSGQVPRRVLEARREVVVGAEHEHTRDGEQRLQRSQYGGDGLEVTEVVAGVDDQVGLQPGE